MDDAEIARKLLKKFVDNNIWGRYHIREDTVPKGFPSHLRHRVMSIAEELKAKGFLVKFPTSHGMQWYANSERMKEIKEITDVQ